MTTQNSLARKLFLNKCLHIFSLYIVDTFKQVRICFLLGYAFRQPPFSALKPLSQLMKWKNNESSEYEAC